MKCDKKHLLLYAVTDRSWTEKQTLYEQVECALKGGVTCVQLREKKLSSNDFLEEAIALSTLCRTYHVPLLINDNVKIAIQCHANGVHVGQNDMDVKTARSLVGEDMIIGVSAHSVEEALKAEQNGADYLGVGAIFATSTKANAQPISFKTLQEICSTVSIPVVAIGGIQRTTIHKLSGSGVDGVALVSAIFGAPDIEQECRLLRAETEKMILKEVD